MVEAYEIPLGWANSYRTVSSSNVHRSFSNNVKVLYGAKIFLFVHNNTEIRILY